MCIRGSTVALRFALGVVVLVGANGLSLIFQSFMKPLVCQTVHYFLL